MKKSEESILAFRMYSLYGNCSNQCNLWIAVMDIFTEHQRSDRMQFEVSGDIYLNYDLDNL